ncbi:MULTISPECIES: baseplate J/gp47 family protein [unclassified Pseudomonas]|uniref:baseplate J/gp47 family protein n=1 Tax=unclassified Pseudomonas TaxID=196821 RepID=UPI00119CE976|nr:MULTISPECIES: baseplate J/gp47 family protein [unclassified Pseudomonas]TWC21116.1 putative phage protein gp47/JayE [Pseudomonas sp. SJZ075]TWC36596.1 putative phage protein gp47/JayE [Pseudomonas sp. SJZ078]TWC57355.1 putative phage protein gp47/JayE [Pseudomonas sp. SJZ124]TWC92348.1 putative phage protein gp47/JayE [Pseudomonas sp. SJZ101]
MAFTVPTYDAILSNILRDIRNQNAEADIGTDSDNYVRSASFAAALEGYYQKLTWLYRQIFPDEADDDEVIHEAGLRGLYLKGAVSSAGPVSLTGTPGVTLFASSRLTHIATGAVFLAIEDVTLSSAGVVSALVRAETPGSQLNSLTGALTLTSPPLGMNASTSFSAATTGGEDQESVESLRARLLDVMQKPAVGGADYDYERWAKEVDGVAYALVLPRRRGGGTVDIVITASNGLPSADVVAGCQAHVESLCSVYADVLVFVPTIRTVDSIAQVELQDGYELADVQASAQRAYDALLGALKPKEGLRRSQIETMVSSLPGVSDRVVTSPAGNVAASLDSSLIGWIRPGTITLVPMV